MRIATWNVERLKHKSALAQIIHACDQARADILVLTETDERVHPDYKFCYQTPRLAEIRPDYYGPSENRVSIFTHYPCIRQHQTYDKHTAICVELETERGPLLVYGTILGIFGNRHPNFKEDLVKQCQDYERLSKLGSLCVAGDYNLSFSDNYYYTKVGRDAIQQTFSKLNLSILTAEREWCIDHIALSQEFFHGAAPHIDEWNLGKTLSDHKGIVIDLL